MKTEIITSAYTEASKLTNEELLSLLKELHELGKLEAPANAKMSVLMKHLFRVERTLYNCWADQYTDVRNSIQLQILDRVRKDKW